ncbi:MAG: serine/threonine protein phosphatase, partial [Clostridia bacterium]|nr:serine/threonine protein phosphatase [Clostridia bacterium]
MDRHLYRNTTAYRRVIAISDIHGNATVLARLLTRLQLTDDDLLIFVGDYVNRGTESIETLAMVMDLAKRENVVVLKGNMDRLLDWYFWRGETKEVTDHFVFYRSMGWGVVFDDWAVRCGYPQPSADNFAELRADFQERYAAEAKFIRELPFSLATEDHLFVHAGVAPVADWRESTEQQNLKNDPFLMHGENLTGKTIVVGHTPVWNSIESANTNNPIFFRDRQVIGIDGGIGVKDFSQLNALIITREGENYRYDWMFEDPYPRVCASTDYCPSETRAVFKDMWPDYFLEKLADGEDFSYCRLTASNREGWAKNEHIATDEQGRLRFVRSSTSVLLPVSAGETLALLDAQCGNFSYVKNAAGQ